MGTLLIICLFLVPVFVLLIRRRSSKRLPPGSLGLPIVGQSLGLLRAMKANTAEKWLQERVDKYGPVSKLSLFGTPTVFIHGQAANKLVFTSDGSTLGNQQIESIQRILGDQTLLKLSGKDHKRVRDALSSFLKPESLKQHVKKMDEEIRSHLENNWQGQEKITVLNQMKTLTFDIICSLLFGLEQGPRRDSFVHNLSLMIDGVWSIPLDLPFSRYRRSLKASDRVQNMVRDLIAEKRLGLEEKGVSPNQDLITRLLSLRGEENEEVMSETEIVHNVLLTMVAGHETSSVVITFFMRLLANNPTVYEAVLKEQEEVAKSKPLGELLTWEDLSKMKYTWRVALEIMRVDPPVFGGFRTALKDIEYEGYIIPKGWQIFWVASMTHMDNNIFSDPTRFDPSRFENQGSIPPYTFIAFGAGYRICPGYEFAKMEILVAIHHLITRFSWKLVHTDNRFSRDPSPIPTEGLPVYLFPKN